MTDNTTNADPRMTSGVVYQLAYHGEVRKDIPFADGPSRAMDIYYPEQPAQRQPAVILVTGFPDPGYHAMTGMLQKEVGWYVSWARLLAASGIAAITYRNQDPENDVATLIGFLQESSDELGIDTNRLGAMAMSGNGPNLLGTLMSHPAIRCAVFWYGYMMDVGAATHVADAARNYRFTCPGEGSAGFPDSVPLMIARAGKDDNPGLNDSIDNFCAEALARNAPVSLVNYPQGEHCFDILDDSAEAKSIIRLALTFLNDHLCILRSADAG